MSSSIVTAIGGSDSSGGAGIQADLRALAACGVRSQTVITAVTSQTMESFLGTEAVADETLVQQLSAVARNVAARTPTSVPKSVFKIGMLATPRQVELVSQVIMEQKPWVVLDPVLRATSGGVLAGEATKAAIIKLLIPNVDLITPNIPEAEALTGQTITCFADMRLAAEILIAIGAKRVLIKGGHCAWVASSEIAVTQDMSPYVYDYAASSDGGYWISGERLAVRARGTGCVLSSTIAAQISLGLEVDDALIVARARLTAALRDVLEVGSPDTGVSIYDAPSYLMPSARPLKPGELPLVHRTDEPPLEASPPFASALKGQECLGFYPIVDRASWVRRLVEWGVGTVQLRIKDLRGEALMQEIVEAVAVARSMHVRLFINDHLHEAMAAKAYGVHLGQEDLNALNQESLEAIRSAGLRLGISTHNYFEAARALALRPSYIALGPIFPTTCKSMRFSPQGWRRLREWSSMCLTPVVAIGGLTLAHAPEAYASGASGIAVMSDLLSSHHPEDRVRQWLAFEEMNTRIP